MNYERSNAAGWLVLGGVMGAAAALLFAPGSGKETRQRLVERWRTTREQAGEWAGELADEARGAVDNDLGERASGLAGEIQTAAQDAAADAMRVARRRSRA
jgi:gas vesicle protein